MEKARDPAEALAWDGSSERPYQLTAYVLSSLHAISYLIDYRQNLIGFIVEILQVSFPWVQPLGTPGKPLKSSSRGLSAQAGE